MISGRESWGARAALPEQTVSKWGTKHACATCGCKFYDMNRPQPACPKCGGPPAVARPAHARARARRPVVPVPDFDPDETLDGEGEGDETLDDDDLATLGDGDAGGDDGDSDGDGDAGGDDGDDDY